MSYLAIALRRSLVLSAFEGANGRFITVTFTKKDGSTRRMNIQPDAVHTHTTGCKSEVAAAAVARRRINNPHLLPVYDMGARRIKSINLDTVSRIVIDKVEIQIAA